MAKRKTRHHSPWYNASRYRTLPNHISNLKHHYKQLDAMLSRARELHRLGYESQVRGIWNAASPEYRLLKGSLRDIHALLLKRTRAAQWIQVPELEENIRRVENLSFIPPPLSSSEKENLKHFLPLEFDPDKILDLSRSDRLKAIDTMRKDGKHSSSDDTSTSTSDASDSDSDDIPSLGFGTFHDLESPGLRGSEQKDRITNNHRSGVPKTPTGISAYDGSSDSAGDRSASAYDLGIGVDMVRSRHKTIESPHNTRSRARKKQKMRFTDDLKMESADKSPVDTIEASPPAPSSRHLEPVSRHITLDAWRNQVKADLCRTHGLPLDRFVSAETSASRVKNTIIPRPATTTSGKYIWYFNGQRYSRVFDSIIVTAAENGPLFPNDVGIQFLFEFTNSMMSTMQNNHQREFGLDKLRDPMRHPLIKLDVVAKEQEDPFWEASVEEQKEYKLLELYRRLNELALTKQSTVHKAILGPDESNPQLDSEEWKKAVDNAEGWFVPQLMLQCFYKSDTEPSSERLGKYLRESESMKKTRPCVAVDKVKKNLVRASTVLKILANDDDTRFDNVHQGMAWAQGHHGSHLCDDKFCIAQWHGKCDTKAVNMEIRMACFRHAINQAVGVRHDIKQSLDRRPIAFPLLCDNAVHFGPDHPGEESDNTECCTGIRFVTEVSPFQCQLGAFMLTKGYPTFRDIPSEALSDLTALHSEPLVNFEIAVVKDNLYLVETFSTTLGDQIKKRHAESKAEIVARRDQSDDNVITIHDSSSMDTEDEDADEDDDSIDAFHPMHTIISSIPYPSIDAKDWRNARDSIDKLVDSVDRNYRKLCEHLSAAHRAWVDSTNIATRMRDKYHDERSRKNETELRTAARTLNIKRVELEHIAIYTAWARNHSIREKMQASPMTLYCVMCFTCFYDKDSAFRQQFLNKKPKEPFCTRFDQRYNSTKWCGHVKQHITDFSVASHSNRETRYTFNARTVHWAYALMLRECSPIAEYHISKTSKEDSDHCIRELAQGKPFSQHFLQMIGIKNKNL